MSAASHWRVTPSDWLEPMTPTLKRVFLVHGEPAQSAALARAIEEKYRIPVSVPARGESFEMS
jgi:metallo-beta-lactamase family protein